MMKDEHSGEFWTIPAGNLMCKFIYCESDVGVVYELVVYDKGELLVCSICANDEVVTCTRTSGHFTVYEFLSIDFHSLMLA